MFHLHGEAAGRTPVSALLQAMLLPVHPAVADGAAAAVPALPRQPSPTRAGQLPMGRGGHAAARHAAAGRGPPAAAGHRERQVRGRREQVSICLSVCLTLSLWLC